MKRIVSLLAVVALTIAASTVVFAHGHGGGTVVAYSVCAITDCAEAGLHTHNAKMYTAHSYNDGHDYHDYCAVETCTLTGYHSHDEVYCFGHTNNDGHSYHGYCGIANCGLTGYHEHSGASYFTDGNNVRGVHHSERGHH